MNEQPPLTPYAGTSGWSGSETSHDRAVTEDSDGTTADRQTRALLLLGRRRQNGLTWKEVAHHTGWHHGQASGALSVLHKEGKIARLKARRDRCAIYVLPEYVEGRDVSPHGRAPSELDQVLTEWLTVPDNALHAKADLWPERFVAAVRSARG